MNERKSLKKYLAENGAFIVVSSLWWAIFSFLTFAWVVQMVLLSINSTLFEATKHRHQIAYFRGYNTCDMPFAGRCCRMELLSGDAIVWNLMGKPSASWSPGRLPPPGDPDLQRESENVCANPWENRYWSCLWMYFHNQSWVSERLLLFVRFFGFSWDWITNSVVKAPHRRTPIGIYARSHGQLIFGEVD